MRFPFLVIAVIAFGVTGCGQDAHHLASIASKLGRQVAAGSERVRETALGRLFQNRSVLDQVPLTDRARIRLRLDRSLQGLEITVRQVEAGCLELTGEVPDEAARQAAVQSVQQVPGVEKVADGLKIAGSAPIPQEEKKEDGIPPPPGNNPVPAPMPGGGNNLATPPPPAVNPGNTNSPTTIPPPPAGPGNTPTSSSGNGGTNKTPASGIPPLPVPGTIPPAPGGAPGASPVTIPPPPPGRPG